MAKRSRTRADEEAVAQASELASQLEGVEEVEEEVPQLSRAQAEQEVAQPSMNDLLAQGIALLLKKEAEREAGAGVINPEMKAMMEALTGALGRMSDNQLVAAKMVNDAQKALHRPSNEVVHNRSVFNPRGEGLVDYTKPVLLCPMHIPEVADNAVLTREEVELLNLLTQVPGTYVINRIDDTKIKLSVLVDLAMDEKTPSRLVIRHETAFNGEYFRLMPSKHSMLRQMLGQVSDQAARNQGESIRQKAREVLSMEEEAALISAGKLSFAA